MSVVPDDDDDINSCVDNNKLLLLCFIFCKRRLAGWLARLKVSQCEFFARWLARLQCLAVTRGAFLHAFSLHAPAIGDKAR